jgi:hypothetical protein
VALLAVVAGTYPVTSARAQGIAVAPAPAAADGGRSTAAAPGSAGRSESDSLRADDGPPLLRGRPPAMPTEETARRLRVAPLVGRLALDGRLDEPAWAAAPTTGAWRQVVPEQGVLAEARTEVRVLQDARGLYVGVRAFRAPNGAPPRNRDLRRDFTYAEHDVVSVILDPFRDRRGVWLFGVAATGNQADYTYTLGAGSDMDWDAPWRARTAPTDSGWTAELAIPWHVLPFPPGDTTWGFNLARGERSLNETSMWSPVPRGNGLMRPNFLGRLDGVRPPAGRAPVQVQPYALGRERRGAIGGDVKWRPTRRTVVDLTVNTDFAQADVDRQVVNLSRFSVLFPERRPFFQEGRLLFTTGIDDRVQPFFTRRIGLDDAGRAVPIVAGTRVVQRTPAGHAALLAVRQGAAGPFAASDVAVARATRNLGARTRLGLLALGRRDARRPATDASDGGAGRAASRPDARLHATAGADAYVQLSPIANVEAAISGTWTRDTLGAPAARSLALAGHVRAAYAGSRTAGTLSLETARAGYRPLVGFLGRTDYTRLAWAGDADLRPAWRPAWLRRFLPAYDVAAVWGASSGALEEARLRLTPVLLERHDGARASLAVEAERQVLARPFAVLPGVTIAPGRTDATRLVAGVQTDGSRALVARLDATAGGYFDGRAVTATGQLSWAPVPHAALTVRHTVARLADAGRAGPTTTHLVAPELRLAWSPRLQLTAFHQHNTAARQGSTNVRLSWELQPLSLLHVVWNDRRAVPGLPAAVPASADRELVVKLSYLFAR